MTPPGFILLNMKYTDVAVILRIRDIMYYMWATSAQNSTKVTLFNGEKLEVRQYPNTIGKYIAEAEIEP